MLLVVVAKAPERTNRRRTINTWKMEREGRLDMQVPATRLSFNCSGTIEQSKKYRIVSPSS